ncbi:unnamed protein product [Oppiella nova]|uniref:ARID domain-containing protein n=1 Tax=Oppiella nova TaxID=334625 RepID=A0A7R9LBA2_9ACAR|nr:unnamed protein product [Oppiella nova]CAG2160897.1 unnamed protein product [Oppiella nova]
MFNRNVQQGYHQPPGMGPPVPQQQQQQRPPNSAYNSIANSVPPMTQNNASANNGNNSGVRYPGQPVSGPTPTLNQLLQSPNTIQRYHNHYDYPGAGQQPPNKDHNLAQQHNQPIHSYRNQSAIASVCVCGVCAGHARLHTLTTIVMTSNASNTQIKYQLLGALSLSSDCFVNTQTTPSMPSTIRHTDPVVIMSTHSTSAIAMLAMLRLYEHSLLIHRESVSQQQQHNSTLNMDESSNSSERSTPTGKPTTPGPPLGPQVVRVQNHQQHPGMSPGYGGGPQPLPPQQPNNTYGAPGGAGGPPPQQQPYGNHQPYGLNNNMMPPPTCYPTKGAPIPSTSPNGAQAAAQAAVIAAERSAVFAPRAPPPSPHASVYLRQHLQQRMYQPNNHFAPHGAPPMGPGGGPMMHGPPGAPMGHGMPGNDTMGPEGREGLPNSGYPMGAGGPQQHVTVPPGDGGPSAATSVTQSITSPLSATPSLSNSIADVRASGPQPPAILDEASQASTTSSQAEDSSDTPTPKHNSKHTPGLSHPPTPNTLGSPGAASLSSFHDEFESMSSPSWPRTPASPVVNSQGYDSHSGHNVKRPDGLMKLYDMSDEPERRAFLDKLIQYQDERGTPISQCPTISKLPLDLFRLYMAVKERGGFLEVTRGKLWKDCTHVCNIATSSSAAYTLRKQYMKHLLPFECKYDRGGVDPAPLLASLDSANRKNKKNAVPPPPPAPEPQPFQSHPGAPNMDGYGPGPGAYPPQQPFPPPPQNSMPNSDYPPHHPAHQQGYPGHPPPGHQQPVPNSDGYPPQHQPPHQQSPYPQHPGGPPPPPNSMSNSDYPPHHPAHQQSGYPGHPPGHPPPPNSMSNSEYPPQQQQQHPPHQQPGGGYPPHPSGPQSHNMSGQTPASLQALANHNESISVKDPFADDLQHQSGGYPSRGGGGGVAGAPHPQRPPSQSGPQSGPQSQSGSTPAPQSNEYNIAAQPTTQPSHPVPQNHFGGVYNEPYGRQSAGPGGQAADPYSVPPPQQQQQPQGYPPSRMAHPPPQTPYYNQQQQQQQSYDTHRSDNRFEPHGRPPSQESMYGQQPPQPPVSQHQPPPHGPRGQYPMAGNQPAPPHPSNTPPSSTPNYTRSGGESSPIGQYGGVGAGGMGAYNSTPDGFKSNQDYQNYSSSQPLYSNATSGQPLGPMSAPKSIPGTGANATAPPGVLQTQTGTTWHPGAAGNQFAQKRHPDFMKQEQHFQPVNNAYGSQPPPQQPMPPTGQFPPYAAPPSRQQPPNQPSSQPLPWSRDNQYRAYGPPVPQQHMPPNSTPGAPPFSGGPPPMSQMRGGDGWDHMSRVDNNGPNWSHNRFNPSQQSVPQPPHELYAGPTPYGGGHQINKMSNFGPRGDPSRQFMSNMPNANKVPPHMMPPQHQSMGGVGQSPYSHPPQPPPHHPMYHQIKKEIIFPPDSVEATAPTMSKRRRLCSRDLSSVEAWRLIMCLKSGLLAESTWALDILSVLLHDDSTILYFGLQHMPGMLEVLLEHYKRYLSEIFDGLFDDTEIGFESTTTGDKEAEAEETATAAKNRTSSKLWYELTRDLSDSDDEGKGDEDEERCTTPPVQRDIPPDDQLVLLNTTNFTFKSRNGKPVRIKNGKSLFIDDPDKKWDQMRNGFTGGVGHWSVGNGERTDHIQTYFESDENFCRFVRVMRKCRKRNRNSSFSWKMTAEDRNCQKSGDDLSVATSGAKNNLLNDSRVKVEIKVERSFDLNDNHVVNNTSSDKESVKSDDSLLFPRVRDSDLERFNKRKDREEYEDESYDMDEPAVQTGYDYQDSLTRRCLCLSTLLRNLSFVPGNDENMSKHSGLLLVLSRLLLLHHSHTSKKRHFERSIEEELFASEDREKNEKIVEKEWWWDVLHTIRENTLVTIANLSGQLDLSPYSEHISLPFLDGLLHWAVCPSSYAQDTLPFANYYLSPQRLAFESLSKLSILDSNVDLMLATPPWSRIDKLYQNLARSLSRHEDQTIREFSVVLLSNLSSADSSSARAIALTGCAIPLLISFVEQAEQSALQVANAQGINALRENPELMGTTLDMVRRSASTLRCLSRVPDNRQLFLQFQQRLLALVMSQILDQGVAGIIADVIYECSLARVSYNCEPTSDETVNNTNHNNNNNETSSSVTTTDHKSDNKANNECNDAHSVESGSSSGDENNGSTATADKPAPPSERDTNDCGAGGDDLDNDNDNETASTDSSSTANT